MTVGDWVKPYRPGIWQIYRVLTNFYELRFSSTAPKLRSKRQLLFSKRLFNAKWKPSFDSEVSERSLVSLLPPDEKDRVDYLLVTDPFLASRFNEYTPKAIDLICNLSTSIPDKAEVQSVCSEALLDVSDHGFTLDEILALLDSAKISKYVGKTPIQTTIQLVCHDHEVKNSEFIFRSWKVLPF